MNRKKAIAMFTLFTSTGSLRDSHLQELHPPFTRTNHSLQSPVVMGLFRYSTKESGSSDIFIHFYTLSSMEWRYLLDTFVVL